MGYEFFYGGSDGSGYNTGLEPYSDTLFQGYTAPAKEIGMATDPRVANQIGDVSSRLLSSGAKTFEISAVSPEVLDSVPKQQFKEIHRLTKLTGTEPTMHGPIVEFSGYTQQGWNESAKRQAENQMFNAVERAHELNPKGNIPVTFHSTAMLPEGMERIKYSEKPGEKSTEQLESFYVVNKDTGEIAPIQNKEKTFPGPQQGKFTTKNYKEEVARLNKEQWMNQLHNLNYNYRHSGVDEIKNDLLMAEAELKKQKPDYKMDNVLKSYAEYSKTGNLPAQEKITEEYPEKNVKGFFNQLQHSELFLRQTYNGVRDMYNMINRHKEDLEPEDRKKLEEYKKRAAKVIDKTKDKRIEDDPRKIIEFADIVEDGIRTLGTIKSPPIFQPMNKFLIDKSGDTIANTALRSYKQFKDNSPIISIENPPAGAGLSRGEDLEELVEEAQRKFVKKAQHQGISEGEAEKIAKKLIGVTWDVGHINMLRKHGYEKKDLIKETGEVAHLVKHVHLSDNFGLEHTELPMGMGNVPIKEMMQRIGQEGFEGKKIIEAGNWFQHFKTLPFSESLEAMGSPLYGGGVESPYWNQLRDRYGSYFSGQGKTLPEQHFSLYGSGFTSLPTELGGQIPGKNSRVTGTPID
jgi:hypothetical protein